MAEDKNDLQEFLQVKSDGIKPRLEVWYLSATDKRTGDGLWVHFEVVTSTDSKVTLDGWVAHFREGKEPLFKRTGRFDVAIKDGPLNRIVLDRQEEGLDKSYIIKTQKLYLTHDEFGGNFDGLEFNFKVEGELSPLYTLTKLSWKKEVLPSSHVVYLPEAKIKGQLRYRGNTIEFDGIGGCSRIFGHGSAGKWVWLHANLEEGKVLEIVSATPNQPGLNKLAPLGFVVLKSDGKIWPRNPITSAIRFKTKINDSSWSIVGRVGRKRLSVTVNLDKASAVSVNYVDPDGQSATCLNSEICDASVLIEDLSVTPKTEKLYKLSKKAHAEIGTRP